MLYNLGESKRKKKKRGCKKCDTETNRNTISIIYIVYYINYSYGTLYIIFLIKIPLKGQVRIIKTNVNKIYKSKITIETEIENTVWTSHRKDYSQTDRRTTRMMTRINSNKMKKIKNKNSDEIK